MSSAPYVDALFKELVALWGSSKVATHVRSKLPLVNQVRIESLLKQAQNGNAPHDAVPPSKIVHYRERRVFDEWVILRGRMSQQVAKETFCSELLAILEHDARFADIMLPDVQRVINTAHAAQSKAEKLASKEAIKEKGGSPIVRLEGYREDPAFVALLWFVRSTNGQHEINIRSFPNVATSGGNSRPVSSPSSSVLLATQSQSVIEALGSGLTVSELAAASSASRGSNEVTTLASSSSVSSVVSAFLLCARVLAPYASFWIEVGAKAATRSRIQLAVAGVGAARSQGGSLVGNVVDASPAVLDAISFVDNAIRGPLLRLAAASAQASSTPPINIVKEHLLAELNAALNRVIAVLRENARGRVWSSGTAFIAGPHVTIADLLLVSCLFFYAVKSGNTSSSDGAKQQQHQQPVWSSSSFVNALPDRMLRGYALAVLSEVEGFPFLVVDKRAAVRSKL